MTVWHGRLIDSVFPPDKLRFVTDNIISFNPAPERKYEWYEVDSRDRLKQVMKKSFRFYIAVSKNVYGPEKLLYTVEHLERNGFFLAIRSIRGSVGFDLNKFSERVQLTGYRILPYTEEIYELL